MTDEIQTEGERRQRDGAPPTVILQSYQAMGPEGRRRMRQIGGAMMAVGVGAPMAIEPFKELSWVYWTFAGFVAIAGLCLLWPEVGFVLMDRIARVLARFIPGVRPDRREKSGDEA